MAVGRLHIEPVIHSYSLAFSEGVDKEWRLVKPTTKWNRLIYDSQNTGHLKHRLVRKEGDAPVEDEAVNNAYDYVGVVLDYFDERFKWRSFDNDGKAVIVNVHYLVKYNNAFWDGEQIFVGDGDGTNFNSFANSIVVFGQGITSAVIQYTAKFQFKNESGALHVHFRDIIAMAIYQDYNNETAATSEWVFGTYKGKAMKSFKEPANKKMVSNPQPEHYSNKYKGTIDNGGVNLNSGILNRAFYLTSMQIGTQKAALLWFEALKTMKPNAKFIDLYKALKKVAPDLIAKDSIPQNTLDVLLEAFTQVGILEEDKKKKQIVKK